MANRYWKDLHKQRRSGLRSLVTEGQECTTEMRDVPGLGMVRVTVCPPAYAEGAGELTVTRPSTKAMRHARSMSPRRI